MAKGFSVTKLASSGGFLKEGNTTLLIGVAAGQVDEVIDIIKEVYSSREQVTSLVSPVAGPNNNYALSYRSTCRWGGYLCSGCGKIC